MADFITIDVQGMGNIDRFFRNAEKAFSDRVIMNAMKVAALVVQNEARGKAPYRTGTLRRSILIGEVPAQLAVKIGSDLPYAARMEYGFVGKDAIGRRYNQPAYPYLRPALGENRERVIKIVRDAVNRQLRRAGR